MAYNPDFNFLQDIFSETTFMGLQWIIPMVLTFLGIVMITRNIEKWKILLLPMAVTMRIMGVMQNTGASILILAIGVILFVIETQSV